MPVVSAGNAGELAASLRMAFGMGPDMNPAHILRECLTNPDWGLGAQDADIGASFDAAADTLWAEGFGLSLIWQRDSSIEAFMAEVLDHIDATLYVDLRTGLWEMRLIRADYVPADLPVFDETSVADWGTLKRPEAGDLVNAVTLRYTDARTNKTGAVTLTDTALVQQMGEVVATTVEYPGIRYQGLASRVAERDLRALSAPLLTGEVVLHRAADTIRPGDVIALHSPRRGLDKLPMRVSEIDRGDGRDNGIRVKITEDVFALGGTALAGGRMGGPAPITSRPRPMARRHVAEAPYWQLVQELGHSDADARLAEDPDAAALVAAGESPSPDTLSAELFVDPGTGYAAEDEATLAPTALLAAALSDDPADRTVAVYGLDGYRGGRHRRAGGDRRRAGAHRRGGAGHAHHRARLPRHGAAGARRRHAGGGARGCGARQHQRILGGRHARRQAADHHRGRRAGACRGAHRQPGALGPRDPAAAAGRGAGGRGLQHRPRSAAGGGRHADMGAPRPAGADQRRARRLPRRRYRPRAGVSYAVEVFWVDPATGAAITPPATRIAAGTGTSYTLTLSDIPAGAAPANVSEADVRVVAARDVDGRRAIPAPGGPTASPSSLAGAPPGAATGARPPDHQRGSPCLNAQCRGSGSGLSTIPVSATGAPRSARTCASSRPWSSSRRSRGPRRCPRAGTAGDIYIVPSGAASNAGEIALWDGPSGSEAWVYITPAAGWEAWVADEARACASMGPHGSRSAKRRGAGGRGQQCQPHPRAGGQGRDRRDDQRLGEHRHHPRRGSVDFPVGTLVNVTQAGAGTTTIAAAAGVTLNGVSAGSTDMDARWAGAALYKRGVDAWVVQGAVGAVA